MTNDDWNTLHKSDVCCPWSKKHLKCKTVSSSAQLILWTKSKCKMKKMINDTNHFNNQQSFYDRQLSSYSKLPWGEKGKKAWAQWPQSRGEIF